MNTVLVKIINFGISIIKQSSIYMSTFYNKSGNKVMHEYIIYYYVLITEIYQQLHFIKQ